MRCAGEGMPTSASQSIARARACLRVSGSMRKDGLRQLVADSQQRIEAGQRILEDHADAAPA